MSNEESQTVAPGRGSMLQTMQDYESFEASLEQARSVIVEERSNSLAVDTALDRIDGLYAQHIEDSESSLAVHEDQRAFLHFGNLVLARARGKIAGAPAAISVGTFLSSLRELAEKRSERRARTARLESLEGPDSRSRPGSASLENADRSENAAWADRPGSAEDTGNGGQRSDFVDYLGGQLVRAAGTAVLPPAMPELSEARRRAGHTGQRTQAPTSQVVEPEAPDNADSEDKLQSHTLKYIRAVVQQNEEANDYEPILLYELCLQRESFPETMENLFCVATLVSDGDLWMTSNETGLPMIGSKENRQKYLQARSKSSSVEAWPQERIQFNFNMDHDLWMKLRQLYPEEALIRRRRARDAFRLDGKPKQSEHNGA